MNEQNPFNPAVPTDFKLLTEAGATEQPQQPPGTTADNATGAHKANRKSKRSGTGKRVAGSRSKKKCRITWRQMRKKLDAKLGGLDKEKLKTVLVACGIAGGVVLTIIVAVKLVPLAVLLLALLGLAGVIRIWDVETLLKNHSAP